VIRGGELAARTEWGLGQPRQEAWDLGAAQLIVARARDLAVPLGLGHLGEIRERATAADHHVGREGRLPDSVLDGLIDGATQRLPVFFLQRVGLAVPFGEADGAERE